MNSALKKFIAYSLFAGALLLFGGWLVIKLTMNQINFTPVFFVVPLVMVVTILFHSYLLQAIRGQAKFFIGKFMASSGIKLMIYLTVIVVYVVLFRQNAKVFLTTFLISYIVFTFIEVVFILKYLKK